MTAPTTTRRKSGPKPMPWSTAWEQSGEAFDLFLVAAGRTKETRRLRKYRLQHFARSVGKGPLDIVHNDVMHYMASCHEDAAETRRSKMATLRVFYQWLLASELIEQDPTKGMPSIRPGRPTSKPCPDAVIRDALANEQVPEAVKFAIRILMATGVRRGELARIRPTDVTFDDNEIPWLSVIGKGGVHRRIPLPADIAAEIERTPGQYLFPAQSGGIGYSLSSTPGHISEHYLGKLVSRALGGKWTAHTLRHRYATKAYRDSSDIRSVQALLGHASIQTTQRYVAVHDSALVTAARAALLPGGA